MANTSKIKWSDRDNKEFQRIRKNWNAKVKRLEDAGKPAPERIAKINITTRKDFNVLKKDAKSFTARGSEKIVDYYGNKIPKYEKEIVSRRVRSVNAKKAYERKLLQADKGTLTLKNKAETEKVNPKKKRTAREWEKFKKSLEKQASAKWSLEQMQEYKDNYIKTLNEHLPKYADTITQRIQNIPPDKFARAIFTDDRLSIQFVYDPTSAEIRGTEIFEAWGEYIDADDGLSISEFSDHDIFDYDDDDFDWLID